MRSDASSGIHHLDTSAPATAASTHSERRNNPPEDAATHGSASAAPDRGHGTGAQASTATSRSATGHHISTGSTHVHIAAGASVRNCAMVPGQVVLSSRRDGVTTSAAHVPAAPQDAPSGASNRTHIRIERGARVFDSALGTGSSVSTIRVQATRGSGAGAGAGGIGAHVTYGDSDSDDDTDDDSVHVGEVISPSTPGGVLHFNGKADGCVIGRGHVATDGSHGQSRVAYADNHPRTIRIGGTSRITGSVVGNGHVVNMGTVPHRTAQARPPSHQRMERDPGAAERERARQEALRQAAERARQEEARRQAAEQARQEEVRRQAALQQRAAEEERARRHHAAEFERAQQAAERARTLQLARNHILSPECTYGDLQAAVWGEVSNQLIINRAKELAVQAKIQGWELRNLVAMMPDRDKLPNLPTEKFYHLLPNTIKYNFLESLRREVQDPKYLTMSHGLFGSPKLPTGIRLLLTYFKDDPLKEIDNLKNDIAKEKALNGMIDGIQAIVLARTQAATSGLSFWASQQTRNPKVDDLYRDILKKISSHKTLSITGTSAVDVGAGAGAGAPRYT